MLNSANTITVSAVVLTTSDGAVALVRKHGTQVFIFPGGKPEPGETGVQTAIREVAEELGVTLGPQELTHVGDFTTPAANEAHTQLFSKVYTAQLPTKQRVAARAEIAQVIWVTLDDVELPKGTSLAPLSQLVLNRLNTRVGRRPDHRH